MSDTLTTEELAVLRLAADYGAGLDLSGPRVPAKVKRIVRDLLKRGFLLGKISNSDLSPKARVRLGA